VDGTPFGRYRLVELLGRGGMGEVWRAHDTATNRTVAIKLLPPHLVQDDTFVQRFRREAEAAARLNSPNSIPIHDYGEIDGRLFVNMRLIEGRDLHDVIAEGPLEPARAVSIIEQAARALHAAHKIGLVHRDVKPSNILLDEDDFVYLIDFGIARAAADTGITRTGQMIGTWAYMAPERFTSKEVDRRSDIYALACVLFECLTGDQPYESDSLERVFAGHMLTPPPRPSTTQPNVPPQLDQVIATGMAKDPLERYATAVELAAAARDAITAPMQITAENSAAKRAQSTDPVVATEPPPSQAWQTEPAPSADPGVTATELADWTNQPPTLLAPIGTPLTGPQPTKTKPPASRERVQTVPPASSGRRIGALLVDAIPLLIVCATAYGIGQGTATQSCSANHYRNPAASVCYSHAGAYQKGTLWVAAIVLLLYVIWNWGFRQGKNGATIGQSVLGLEVVRPDTGRPDGLAGRRLAAVAVSAAVIAGLLMAGVGGLSSQTFSLRHHETPLGPPYVVLPFKLKGPAGVAVDGAGSVYVTDTDTKKVLKLSGGGTAPVELPFTSPTGYEVGDVPVDLAADAAGNVYVAYGGLGTSGTWGRVLKLTPGMASPSPVAFQQIANLKQIGVDAAGDIYLVSDGGVTSSGSHFHVWKLASGASTAQELPFGDLSSISGLAVDSAGNVYVAGYSSQSQVLKLAAGATTATHLPITTIGSLATDQRGNVYIGDYQNVVKLAPGASNTTELPFGNFSVNFIAADAAGNVYVTDGPRHQVLKLPAA
jgi:serine/threonine-protein kinase